MDERLLGRDLLGAADRQHEREADDEATEGGHRRVLL
jgi:hypothetical protein